MLKPKHQKILFFSLPLLGAVCCGILWWIGLSEDPVIGCGIGGCDKILGSRWAWVFLIPVSWYGVFFYAAWLGCEWARMRGHRVWFAGAAVGAAVWFIMVQALILKAFCPWCMSTHAVGLLLGATVLATEGLAVVKKLLAVGLVGGTGLALVQVYGPHTPSHLVEVMGAPEAEVDDDQYVSFEGGKIRSNRDEYPRLGSRSAEHVVVELFDYQCLSCRLMSGYLKALVEAYPEQVAVILVPVPMDRSCNRFVQESGHYHGSCAISRIALAVWAAHPAGFGEFHEALMSAPSEALARELALAFIEQNQLEAVLYDRAMDSTMEQNIAAWRRLSRASSSLPKLLISDRRVLHGLPASKTAFLKIMKTELSLD